MDELITRRARVFYYIEIRIPSTDVEFTLHMATVGVLRKSEVDLEHLHFLLFNAMDISRIPLRLEKIL